MTAAVMVAAPASWVLAQVPVFELERSVDGMASWQHVPITGAMVTPEGTLRMAALAPEGSAFFRMKITSDGGVLIPAGSFTMGRTSGDDDSDAPPVTVSVSAFYMGKYEVTKEDWDAVRTWGATNGYTDLAAGNGGVYKGADHPVHSIAWYDMVKWCNARSEMAGLTPCYAVSGVTYKTGTSDAVVCDWSATGYRLPTEAEWEKAARGGVSEKRFPWGTDTITHSQANYNVVSFDGTTNVESYDVTPRPPDTVFNYYHPTYNGGMLPYSSPVARFAPNGYGLYDMAGNSWEWCWDWYSSSYYVTGVTNPRGPSSGSTRVIRGGSGFSGAGACRLAQRSSFGPTTFATSRNIGFRVARSSVP